MNRIKVAAIAYLVLVTSQVVPGACAELIFDDGAVHTIDYVIDSAEVVVKGDGTTLNIVPGGAVTQNLYVREKGVVNLSGGTLQGVEMYDDSQATISSGRIDSFLFVNGGQATISGGDIIGVDNWDGQTTISGGQIGGVSNEENGQLTISGGEIGSVYNYGQLTVSDGHIQGDLESWEGKLTLSGGLVDGNAFAWGSAWAIMTGGRIGGSFGAYNGSYIVMDGGVVDGWVFADNGYLDVNGGRIGGSVDVTEGGGGVSGGVIMGDLSVWVSDVSISGGKIEGDLYIDPSVWDPGDGVTIEGSDFAINGVPASGRYTWLDYPSGHLTGFLDNGDPLDLDFSFDGNGPNDPAWASVLYLSGSPAGKHTITISSSSGGSVSLPGVGSFEYDHGTSVPIIATAQANHHFTGWTGTAVDAGKVADPASTTATVTVEAEYTLQANFVIDQRTLTVSPAAGGVVSVPGEGIFSYDHGTQVQLQAEPYPLYAFVGWRGEVFSSDNPIPIAMDANRSVRPCFESVLSVLYVDDDAPTDPGSGDPTVSDPGENGTMERPFDTVQEAIDVAKPGAKVVVRPGTYFETIDLLGKSIEVSGLDESDPNIAPLPIIDGGGKDTVVKCTQGEDPNCVLRGLVITGGKGQLAGGILCTRSSPTVRNCLVVGNRVTSPDGGGGIYCRAGSARFVNCTISGNYGGSTGAGVCFSESSAVLSNSILWENSPAQIWLFASGDSTVAYTAVAGGWPGPENLDVDPLFALAGYWADLADITKALPATDPSAVWVDGDYHLLSEGGRWDPISRAWIKDPATSLCIDAGDPGTPTGQEPSPNGGRVNLGVYGGTDQTSMSPGDD